MPDQKTVLIVDDSPTNIDLLKGLLEEIYKIKVAINGKLALKIASKVPLPDCIILDIEMPEMNGYEVCQALKSNPETAGINIIFMSGNFSDEEKQKGLDLGAVEYFGKPFDPEALMASLEKYTS